MLMPLLGFLLLRQELVQHVVTDTLELRTGQHGQQLPAKVQGLLNGTVGLIALGNVFLLKGIRKGSILLVDVRQGRFAQNDGQFLGFLTAGIGGKELVMVAA